MALFLYWGNKNLKKRDEILSALTKNGIPVLLKEDVIRSPICLAVVKEALFVIRPDEEPLKAVASARLYSKKFGTIMLGVDFDGLAFTEDEKTRFFQEHAGLFENTMFV